MFRYLLFFLTALFFCPHVMAQKKSDTLLFYVNSSGHLTKDKDSAEFAEFVLPYDKYTKEYPVYIYYANGKKKLVGATKTKPGDRVSLVLDGSCTFYYPNGKRQNIFFYKEGKIVGDYEEYYPNGKLYCVKSVVKLNDPLLIECHDSTGTVLTENGKGHWIELNKGLDRIISEGDIADSLKDGEWHGPIGDTGRFICSYKKGKIISGTGYDASGKAYPFTSVATSPVFKKGNDAFKQFLWSNITYVVLDVHAPMRGNLSVYFTVEKSGLITNVGITNPYLTGGNAIPEDYYHEMCLQVIKAVKLSPPWIPGTIYGIPASIQITVPVAFGTKH